MTANVEVLGLGHYAPKHRVTSAEIEVRLGLTEGWIVRRTGIEAAHSGPLPRNSGCK